nr:HAMP domain-containing histidine kinase [Armatimonadota bacterium]
LQGYLETLLMKEGQLTPQEQQEYLLTAINHSHHLSKMVTELFELARLESSHAEIHLEPFSIGELVQDIVQQFEMNAGTANVGLQTHFSVDLPFVLADIGLVQRVFTNLIENALRYTPSGGAVTIILIHKDGQIRVQVEDTGGGIRQEDLSRVFERFYRSKNQPTSSARSGLGLAIAKRILELHGSAIEVASAPDKGAVFSFSLPVYEPEQ